MTTTRPLRRMRLKDRRFSLEGRYSSSEPRILLSSDTYIINNHLGALWCEAVNAELFFDGRCNGLWRPAMEEQRRKPRRVRLGAHRRRFRKMFCAANPGRPIEPFGNEPHMDPTPILLPVSRQHEIFPKSTTTTVALVSPFLRVRCSRGVRLRAVVSNFGASSFDFPA